MEVPAGLPEILQRVAFQPRAPDILDRVALAEVQMLSDVDALDTARVL